jgi:hypothetical protein
MRNLCFNSYQWKIILRTLFPFNNIIYEFKDSNYDLLSNFICMNNKVHEKYEISMAEANDENWTRWRLRWVTKILCFVFMKFIEH